MAIKRKTHLNLSGSHHTLDSDNAFIGGLALVTGSIEITGLFMPPATEPDPNTLRLIVTGSISSTGLVSGSSGSFTYLSGALSASSTGQPFIVAGSNITANWSDANLNWEITGSGGGGTNFFTEIDSTNIFTTSSVELARLSASLGAIITGSVYAGSLFAPSSNFNINGFNIVPLWNHATTSQIAPDALLSGSLLTDNMPTDGIGLFDLNVIAIENDIAMPSNFGSWKMVVTMTSSTSIVGIAGVTELDNVLVGASAASWDVNINNNQIEVTGSAGAINPVYWMAKLTHKMILDSNGQVIY